MSLAVLPGVVNDLLQAGGALALALKGRGTDAASAGFCPSLPCTTWCVPPSLSLSMEAGLDYPTYHPRFGPQSTNASLHAHETLTWLSLSAFVRPSPILGSLPHPWRACTRRARASPSSESLGTPEPRRCRPCSVLSRAWRWSAHACSSRQPRTTGSAVMPPIGASIE